MMGSSIALGRVMEMERRPRFGREIHMSDGEEFPPLPPPAPLVIEHLFPCPMRHSLAVCLLASCFSLSLPPETRENIHTLTIQTRACTQAELPVGSSSSTLFAMGFCTMQLPNPHDPWPLPRTRRKDQRGGSESGPSFFPRTQDAFPNLPLTHAIKQARNQSQS